MRALLTFVTNFLKRLFRRRSLPASDAVSKADVTQQRLSREADSQRNDKVSDELRRLIYRALGQFSDRDRLHASRITLLLKQTDPSFSYEKYQFSKLIDLLRAVPDLVALERVDPASDNAESKARRLPPVYYVRSRLDTTRLITEALRSLDSEDGWVHWQSLAEVVESRSPEFNAARYGFSHFKALLATRTDLVEFKPLADKETSSKTSFKSPSDYVRLISSVSKSAIASRKSGANSSGANPSAANLSVANPSAPSKSAPTKSTPKPALSGSNSKRIHSRKTIESLLKFSGLSMETLHQKVGELAAIALPEKWYYGPKPPTNFAHPILKSYLRYTFVRLQHEQKVMTSVTHRYRAFNTGLLDTLLRPIYALFSPSGFSSGGSPSSGTNKWTLAFCIAGEGTAGKTLVSEFASLPPAANYFENADKAFYYLDAGAPTVDWKHVVKDNMVRLPLAFLKRYAPSGFSARSTEGMSTPDFYDYKRNFAAALDADPSGYRNIVSRLEEALEKTLRRTQVNYTTAVPTYYPKINSVDLLLPMCLVHEHTVDLALVVRREPSGQYIGHTVLTLRQAYNNARLICKLDNHWLPRAMVLSEQEDSQPENSSLENGKQGGHPSESSQLVASQPESSSE